MNIAIIAQDTKKELMVQFCIAYCGILGKHKLCSTSRTGKLVSDATGLSISRFLSGSHGGCEPKPGCGLYHPSPPLRRTQYPRCNQYRNCGSTYPCS